MRQTIQTAILLSLLVILGFSTNVYAQDEDEKCTPEQKTVVFFGNGMETPIRKAKDDKKVLKDALRSELIQNHPDINPDSICYQIAYASDKNIWLDLLADSIQFFGADTSGFWRRVYRLEKSPVFDRIFANITASISQVSYVSNVDLQIQVGQYLNSINQNRKIILVPHSAGNFYANQAHAKLVELTSITKENFEIVSVANPDSFISGDPSGTHTTLFGDVILIVPGRQDANTEIAETPCTKNGQLPGTDSFSCHGFANAYLVGTYSRSKILAQIINAIPTVVQPPTGITQVTNIPSSTPLRLAGINSDGSQVAFRLGNLDSSEGSQLWSVNSDGSNLIQISPNSLNVASAFFSGTKGIFIACETPCGFPGNVYTLNYNGTGLTQLTDDGNGSSISYGIIGISTDGTKVVYLKSTINIGPTLFISNTDGTNVRQLIVPPNSASSNSQFNQAFTLNSDGSRLAFAYRESGLLKIAILNTDNNLFQDVVNIGTVSTLTPVFALSSDGTTLVYGADTVFGTTVGLAVVKTDGTGQRLLDQIPFADPTISFDGTEVCYSGLVGPQHTDVLCIRSDGTNRRNVSNTPADSGAFAQPPFISENGAAVAFISNADLDPGKNTDLSQEIFVAGLQ